MDKKWKIIFLDFDGVINGSSPTRYIIWKTMKFLHLKKLYNKIYKEDVYGIHKSKVKRLSRICKSTGSYVVFTSSWRDKAYDAILNNKKSSNENTERLHDLFSEYNIPVIGITNHSINGKRQDEIINWLAKYEYVIEDYIILDDEYSHLYTLRDRLILTSDAKPGKDIQGRWYCREGLRNTHVIQAIKMLGVTYKFIQ